MATKKGADGAAQSSGQRNRVDGVGEKRGYLTDCYSVVRLPDEGILMVRGVFGNNDLDIE